MIRRAEWRRWLPFARPNAEVEVDREIQSHFDHKIAELIASGRSADAARAQAEAEFGDTTAVRSNLIAIEDRMLQRHRRAEWWESVVQDVSYVIRGLRHAPGFTVMVVVTLALGLGANAAIFSVLERLLWRAPAGVAAPSQVRRIHSLIDAGSRKPWTRSIYNYLEMRSVAALLPAGLPLAGYRTGAVRIGRDPDAPSRVGVGVVGDYFGVLGVAPIAGRFFAAEEVRAETFVPVAVISHRVWITQFGGSSSVVGAPLDLGSRRYTIIGVTPPAFRGIDLDVTDVWVPMGTWGTWKGRDPKWYDVPWTTAIRLLVRTRTDADARTVEFAATTALRHSQLIRDSTATATLSSVIESVWPDTGATELTTATRLAGVAAIILLIACANVVNLLLARSVKRRQEIAIRLALGVSRGRLMTQLLIESVALAALGGVAAFLLGAWGASALRHALLPGVVWADSAFDYRIATFTAALALFTGIAAGLAPALRATRPDLLGALKGSARTGGRQRSRLTTGLVIAQAALSVVLLATAGLFVRSLHNVEGTDIGYDASRILFASVSYDPEGDSHYDDVGTRMPDVADRIARLPGVEHVGATVNTPMNAISFVDAFLPNHDSLPQLEGRGPKMMYVTPGFFAAAGMRVLRGRAFDDGDRADGRLVILVNASMAKTVWPGEDAVGKCLILSDRTSACREVVGVVADAHYHAIVEEASMHFFVPIAQSKSKPFTLVIRTAPGRTAAVAPLVREAMKAEFGEWARPRTQLMEDLLAPQLQPWRLAAMIFASAALLALLVAAVGIYSTVAYAMSQRMHEMGVRMALGARGSDIARLVVREGVQVVLIGVVLGAVLTLALGKLVASMLYNTSARDPGVLITVSLTLLGVALIACLVPAWRAARANPVTALRRE